MKWMHRIIHCRDWVFVMSPGQCRLHLSSHPAFPLNRPLNLSLTSVLRVISVKPAGNSQLWDLCLSVTFSWNWPTCSQFYCGKNKQTDTVIVSTSFLLERRLEKNCRKAGLVRSTLPSQNGQIFIVHVESLLLKTFFLKPAQVMRLWRILQDVIFLNWKWNMGWSKK